MSCGLRDGWPASRLCCWISGRGIWRYGSRWEFDGTESLVDERGGTRGDGRACFSGVPAIPGRQGRGQFRRRTFLCLTPLALAAVTVVFVVTVAVTGHISMGSIVGAATFPLGVWLMMQPPFPIVAASVIASAFIIYKHSSNIARLPGGKMRIGSLLEVRDEGSRTWWRRHSCLPRRDSSRRFFSTGTGLLAASRETRPHAPNVHHSSTCGSFEKRRDESRRGRQQECLRHLRQFGMSLRATGLAVGVGAV